MFSCYISYRRCFLSLGRNKFEFSHLSVRNPSMLGENGDGLFIVSYWRIREAQSKIHVIQVIHKPRGHNLSIFDPPPPSKLKIQNKFLISGKIF